MSRKAFLIAFGIIIAVIIALAVWAFSSAEEKTWDSCHPIANVNISWQQTYYPGSWDSAER